MHIPDIIIAIDGYSSTGKSSFAKRIAREAGFLYLDSGALYRGITLFAIENGMIDSNNTVDEKRLADALPGLDLHFEAGKDADAVIETKRGHSLGRIILCGSAIPNTGVPGMIAGYAAERVIHSPAAGIFHGFRNIGDIVRKGDVIADVSGFPVTATIDGMLRGLLRSGLEVPEGFKIADIDPRGADADYLSVSDKARAVAGGVLEAVDGFLRNHL